MPFSVLRTCFLGLFSWALIGAGIWLGIEFWQALKRPETVIIEQRTQHDGHDDRTPLEVERSVREPNNWKTWLLLAGAIGCIGFSFFGACQFLCSRGPRLRHLIVRESVRRCRSVVPKTCGFLFASLDSRRVQLCS